MNNEEYSSNKISKLSYALRCAAAGGCAGFVSDLLFYPFETMKTYIQSSCGQTSVLTRVRKGKLYSGYACALLNTVPYNSAFFIVYEYVNAELLLRNPHCSEFHRSGIFFISAALGEIAGISVNNPMEVIRQNMQLLKYGGVSDVIKCVLAEKGLRGFYYGYSPALFRAIPFSMIQLPIYEHYQRKFSNRNWNFPSAPISGCLASIFAALITTPSDVIRTRMMTNATKKNNMGFINWVLKTIKEEGIYKGLFRGWQYRFIQGVVIGAFYYTVYDKAFKDFGAQEAYEIIRM